MTNETPKAPRFIRKAICWPPAASPPCSAWRCWYFPPARSKPKTTLSLELESPAEQLKDETNTTPLVQAQGEQGSPFAQIDSAETNTEQAAQEAPATEKTLRPRNQVIVK